MIVPSVPVRYQRESRQKFEDILSIPGSLVPRAKREVTALQPPEDAVDPADDVDEDEEVATAAEDEPVVEVPVTEPRRDSKDPKPLEVLELLEVLLSPSVEESVSELDCRLLIVLVGPTPSMGAAVIAMAIARRTAGVVNFMASFVQADKISRRR